MTKKKGKDTNQQERIDFKQLSVQNIAVAGTIKGHNVKLFLNALKSLNFTTNTEIHFTPNGMKFIAEESQFYQGIAYFGDNFFSQYHFKTKTEIENFGVDLSAFAEFLSALMNNDLTSLKIVYYGNERCAIAFIVKQIDNEIVTKKIKDSMTGEVSEIKESKTSNIVTEYVIRTKHSINPIDFTTIESPITSSCLISCADFTEIITDLDKATEEIQFKITDKSFIVKSIGVIQCNTQIPFSSSHKIFKNFQHFKDTKFTYKFACLKCMLKALAHSNEVCLETQENGLLKVQIKGKDLEDQGSLFYEYNIMSNVIEDNEEVDIV